MEDFDIFNNELFEVKKINVLYTNILKSSAEECAICKNYLFNICHFCEQEEDEGRLVNHCNLVKGKCEHLFHQHCIEKWNEGNRTCPIDRKFWEQASVINNNIYG